MEGSWVYSTGFISSKPYAFELQDLALQITPDRVAVGGSVTMTACLGTPGQPVMLFLVAVAGAAVFQPIPPPGVFDPSSRWTVNGSPPIVTR